MVKIDGYGDNLTVDGVRRRFISSDREKLKTKGRPKL